MVAFRLGNQWHTTSRDEVVTASSNKLTTVSYLDEANISVDKDHFKIIIPQV